MTEERPSLAKIYWILMKPKVVFLLQATAICGVLVYDLSEGYKNDGWKPIDSVFISLIVQPTPSRLRSEFTMSKFASGELVKKGFI